MADLSRALLDLFRSSDGLLLPDESGMEEISIKQHALGAWNEDIVFQGLITMKEFLQELANQANMTDFNVEMNWDSNERSPYRLSERNRNLPSAWELARHLTNWIMVFIPPVRALDLRGDMELVGCLESADYQVSALATMMLEYEEFNYVVSIERFREILNDRLQSALRLEICRLLYIRYRDPEAVRKEIVPNLIASDSQYDVIFKSDVQKKKFLSYIRELVVWDIATKGEGPRKRWPKWWL
jgi:hypothetical protein